jgi:EAL domain-containing protein (putative c-di-GMP-specific phosphodiesterase class I)
VKLSINFLPNGLYEPTACLRATLTAAARVGFDPRRLMFEFTEHERVQDVNHLRRIIAVYRAQGLTTAIDDFGAGYAGLALLAELQPDVLKIDMALIRNIDESAIKRTIVASIVALTHEIGIVPLAKGIETTAELDVIRSLGIHLCQGYLVGRPSTEIVSSHSTVP